jgi:hypothetical protein
MAIVYPGGTIINTTVTGAATNTRTLLGEWIKDRLVAAGWTATGATPDWTVTSAATAVGVTGLSARVLINTDALTNCVRIRMANGDGTNPQTINHFLLPNVAYRIVANRFQFFIWQEGSTAARCHVAGGVLYVPSQLSATTKAVWGCSNAETDTSTTVRPTFRTRLQIGESNNITTQQPSIYVNYNGNVAELQGTGSNNVTVGGPSIIRPNGAKTRIGAEVNAYSDGSFFVGEAQFAATTNGNFTNTPFVIGQLWGALTLARVPTADTTFSFDGHTWIVFTNGNTGTSDNHMSGTLCLAVD